MSRITIFHNSKCSKSRECLALLKESGREFDIVEYLKVGLKESDIGKFKMLLEKEDWARIVRVKEAEYKDNLFNTSEDNLVIEALIKHPKLLERPIVMSETKACIARPVSRLNLVIEA